MDFDIELFLQESRKKIGSIKEIEISYGRYDDHRAKLVITAFNGIQPSRFGDYNCEAITEFLFGDGIGDEKYLQTKLLANSIRFHIKKNYPDIKVYRSTKCSFAWFG